MTCNGAWFPLWIGDYVADTTHLSCEQHGAYFLLMLAYYQRGRPLPDDDAFLASVAKSSRRSWRYLRPVISAFFRIEGGLWHHKRIDAEMADQTARAEVRSRAAAANASKRWKTGYSNENATKSTPESMPPACGPHANGTPRPKKTGYLPGNSIKSMADDMPAACQPHASKSKPSNSQKKLAITNLSGLLDPTVNDFNGPDMLQSQESSLPLYGAERTLSHRCARETTPPLPSQGDGDAASRSPTPEPAAAPAAIDPALLAYGLAKFDDCLAILNGKRLLFDSEACGPLPSEPRILEFRATLSRYNTLAGEKLAGVLRLQAWDAISRADAIGDPDALPPDLTADLAAIASLEGAA